MWDCIGDTSCEHNGRADASKVTAANIESANRQCQTVALHSASMTRTGGRANMLAKPLLALSAYALLFALLAVRIETAWVRATCIALAAIGILGLLAVVKLAGRSEPTLHTVRSVEGPGAEASGHLAGYLLPFVIDPKPTLVDLVLYGIFLFVAIIVTMRTGAIQVNPLLYLFGRRVVQVTDDQGYSFQLVSRGRLIAGETVRATRLSDDISIQRTQ